MVITYLSLFYINNNKENKILSLNNRLDNIESEEQLVVKYTDSLEELKELKQKILGQENTIEEITNQNVELMNLIFKTKNEIENLEKN